MNKILLSLCATAALLTACNTGNTESQDATDARDSIAATVDEMVIDSTAQQQLRGKVIDGAMNSIYVLVQDDTLSFSYPDLARDSIDGWAIDDSVTVNYYMTAQGDSVTAVHVL